MIPQWARKLYERFCQPAPPSGEADPYPTRPIPPAEVINPAVVIGACGIRGCPNMKSHSHVEALARRLREK